MTISPTAGREVAGERWQAGARTTSPTWESIIRPLTQAAVFLEPPMQAPRLDLIDQAFIGVAAGRCDHVVLTTPPRHGRSQRTSRWARLQRLRRTLVTA